MMWRQRVLTPVVFSVLCGLVAVAQSAPQQPAPAPATETPATPAPGRGGGRGGPAVVSPQIEADRRVTFRVLAPNATTSLSAATSMAASCPIRMRLRAPPAPGREAGGAAAPGGHHDQRRQRRLEWHHRAAGQAGRMALHLHHRWRTVVDSRNVNVTTSQTQVQSLLVVPGDFSETRDVPHGTVGRGSLRGEDARQRPARDVRLHAAGIREGHGDGIPCST